MISRVTGGNESQIDGTLRSTIPGADVWLLNPSGVVFGEGARLDVPGSFHASTGDYVGFEGSLERFYSDGRPSVLSTAPPVAFGFLGESGAKPISVTGATLEVPNGESLDLVGGDVTLTSAKLSAPGGAVSIRGGRIVVEEGSKVRAENADEDPAGTITVASESVLVDGSVLSASTHSSGDAGTVTVHADSVRITEPTSDGRSSGIYAASAEASGGNAGIIEVTAGTLELIGGGALTVGVYEGSSGDAGIIHVHADSVLISAPSPTPNGLFAHSYSTGNAGTIEVAARTLAIEAGGQIDAASFGSGGAGTITIDADSVVIADQGIVRSDTSGSGSGGSIRVDARMVLIERQGILHAGSSSGLGKAGTIDVTATESILVTGAGDPRFSLRRIVDAVNEGRNPEITGIFSAGGSGSITLKAPMITLTDGALVLVSTGSGDAGDVRLSGDRIYVRNGAFVDSTSLFPGGNVGNITLEAEELIEVVGSRVGEGENGVPFEDPSRVTSASLGSGEGGTVALRAPRILIDGGAVATTALPSFEGPQGVSGGNIRVNAGELIVRGGGRIDASSFIAGPGGNIDVSASDSILVEGKASDGIASGISSRTGADGLGGAVTLRAPVIEMSGEISAKSEADPNFEEEVGRIFDSLIDDGVWIGTPPSKATGPAGTVMLAADEVRLFGGTIATNAEAADGGEIKIEAKQLVHLDGGEITATVTGGTGGNIFIDSEIVVLQNDSRIEARAGEGTGGDIKITADNYFAFPGSVVDASSELGIDGIVEVHTPDVNLAGQITALPTSFLDAASLMRERCAARQSGKRAGSFAVRGNGGIPAEPDGWLPATLATELERGLAPTTERPSTSASAPRLARLGTCQ